MSATQLPNEPGGLNASGKQTGASMLRTADGTFRPFVNVLRRQEKLAVGPENLGYYDQPASDKDTRSQVAKQFLGGMERWKLLDKYGLLYEYSPIKSTEIRLLHLNPAQRYEDDIFIKIVDIDADNVGSIAPRQPYEALSYHWGLGPAEKPVYIYGIWSNTRVERADLLSLAMTIPDHAKGQRLYVRPNLDKALRSLRDKTKVVVLWVDAICINQRDERVEKPAQIARLKYIYNKASNVLVTRTY
ncbi:heterokaryon incompatibility protein-domain-containing protein [Nemania serpens]|nr:heterokaryon incompatibility protein-domain-containing protein [Nemania serpens]